MWFSGYADLAPGNSPYLFKSAIGYASSTNGVHWHVQNDGAPVFQPGPPGSFDEHSVSHPFVLDRGDHFLMWYAGADGTQGFNQVRIERVGLASSPDGVHWTRENEGKPVLDLGESGEPDSIQVNAPTVVRRPDGYVMWYGAYNGAHSIMTAWSADGLNWVKLNGHRPMRGLTGAGDAGGGRVWPWLRPLAGAQVTDGEELGPSVYHDGSGYYLLFGSRRNREWIMLGAQSANGLDWILTSAGPLLGAAEPIRFDSSGQGQNRSVHPSQLVFSERHAMVWYTGEHEGHQRIGLMVAERR